MHGKRPQLTSLELRKQLLIAESELNRSRLCEDWKIIESCAGYFTRKTRSFFSISSVIALAAAGLAASRNREPKPAPARHSWLQRLVKGARIIFSIWMTLRSRSQKASENS